MTVHFIGAGPGAADLLTLRARDLIASCPLCLYAGSLIPEAILAHCPADARLVNTAPLDLDDIISECKQAMPLVWTWRVYIPGICLSGQQWENSFVVCGLKILL